MAKSKCEDQLERMTQERDHWRKLAHERKQEVDELKVRLQLAMVDLQALNGSAAGGIGEYRAALANALAELQALRSQQQHATNAQLTAAVNDFVPSQLMALNPEEGRSTVGMTLFFVQSAEQGEVDTFKGTFEFPGDQRTAMRHLIPNTLRLLTMLPVPSDYAGTFGEDYLLSLIGEAGIVDLYYRLLAPRYCGARDEYNEARLIEFQALWPALEAKGLNKEEARTRFYQFVDRTFEKLEKKYDWTRQQAHA